MHPVEISHLTKRYPDFVLDDVSLVVEKGYVTGFVGANGSGKTTTLKCALGLVHPDSGTVTTWPRERIGVVFDTPPYNPVWTAGQVGGAIARFFPRWRSDIYTAQLARERIDPGKKISDLSRGMGMRLQMAVALAHEPGLLVLDEPTSGLDPLGRQELVDDLAEFMTDDGHAIWFSTHFTGDLDRLADRLVAVLGCGVDVAYPAAHRGLLRDIAQSGAVVSEFPLGTRPEAFRFPIRNRIISGLSRAVLVVEAGEKSGSLITARLALDQGREVLAIPGSIDSLKSSGAHWLIQQGATLIQRVEDVFEAMAWSVPAGTNDKAAPSPEVPLAPEERQVLQALDAYPADIDRIAGCPPPCQAPAVTTAPTARTIRSRSASLSEGWTGRDRHSRVRPRARRRRCAAHTLQATCECRECETPPRAARQ